MPKKGQRGPYLRPPKPKPLLSRPIDHFLKEWRLALGLTQELLSERSGMSTGSISAIERGEDNPSMETLAKLAAALRITRGMLLDIDPSADPFWRNYATASPMQQRQIAEYSDKHIFKAKKDD